MFKDVCQYFVELLHPKPEQTVVTEIDGFHYKVVPTENGLQVGDQIVKPHPRAPIAKPTLRLQTLRGFVAAHAARVDGFGVETAVHVVDPTTVSLISLKADEYGRRHEFLRAECAEANNFAFGQYMASEKFLIDLQAAFLPTDNVVALQRVASSLTSDSSISVQDDGFGQRVTTKAGSATFADVAVPPRIELYVYRTFREIDPVRAEFMFRVKGVRDAAPQVALMDIDAGKWRMNTVTLVGQWLEKHLPKDTVIIA